jgi:hypothetical protein
MRSRIGRERNRVPLLMSNQFVPLPQKAEAEPANAEFRNLLQVAEPVAMPGQLHLVEIMVFDTIAVYSTPSHTSGS